MFPACRVTRRERRAGQAKIRLTGGFPGRAPRASTSVGVRIARNAVRAKHPRIAGVILALSDEPQHQVAFRQGARGETAVADLLERRTADGPAVLLHDRRMPRGRGNIDHLAVAPTGIYVIDAKNITGDVRVHSPWFGDPRLMVGRRDRTSLIDGLDRQVAAVRAALGESEEFPIHGVLCFTKADIRGRKPTIRSHALLYRRALARRLNARGPLDAAAIDGIADALSRALPPAS